MFAVFPFLKTSEPFGYRSVTFRASDDVHGLPPDARSQLEALRGVFFLKDHYRIKQFTNAFCSDESDPQIVKNFVEDVSELRVLLAYLYSSPHHMSGQPFLRNEHSSVYLFHRKRISRFLIESEHNVDSVQTPEYPDEDDRHEIDGFECEVDGQSTTWITKGSRLYPPCVRLWLNISQNIRCDLEQIRQSARHDSVLAFFARRDSQPSEVHARLLTALKWFGRSIGADVADDAALLHLAAAFESLLGLEQGPEITKRFKAAVMLLIGNVPRADAWLDQFYKARSEIVHRGLANALRFNPYHGLKSAPDDAIQGYRSLTSYGWLIFQICAAAISGGASVARQTGLESMLLTNRQRIEKILKVLASKDAASDRLAAVAADVADIDRYRYVGEPGLTVVHLLNACKAIARCYVEVFPEDPLCMELQNLATITVADTFDALKALRALEERIDRASWLNNVPPDGPQRTVAALVKTAWHYTFTMYFYLESRAAPPVA